MKRENLTETMNALDDLLDAERAALLAGRLDELSRLHLRKEGLFDALNRCAPDDPDVLGDLRGKVERNQDLLDSALDGIRSVARRLATIRRVRQSLDTYDSFGRKKTVDVRAAGSVEKRA